MQVGRTHAWIIHVGGGQAKLRFRVVRDEPAQYKATQQPAADARIFV